MSIKVNGSEIGSSIKLNNTDLSEIIFNGISVWKSFPSTLEECTWAEIKTYIQNGVFPYPIGSTKTFKINNKTYTAEVVAINDGTGDAGQWYPDKTVDFICKELYESTYRMQYSDSYTNGYKDSLVRAFLNTTVYPLLPTDLKNVIINKTHSYSSSRNGSMTTDTAKLWIPTYYEIAGSSYSSVPGETSSNNKAYRLSTTIKALAGGAANNWWLGSLESSYDSHYWIIKSNGAYSTAFGSNYQGVPICFRIG